MTAADPPPLMPGGESTSAQLRRVRQDRDAVHAGLTKLRREHEALAERAAKAEGELKELLRHQEIRARVIREKNAKLREVEHLLGIDAIYPPRDVADAVRELLAELTRLRVDLKDERATLAQVVADYADAADELQLLRPTIPTSKETTMPATADDGSRAETLLSLPLPANDADAATVRDYLIALLLVTWESDLKRPFGNSGWQYDLYTPMVKAGLIPGELDDDGYVTDFDARAADALVVEAIRALRGTDV